MLTSVTFMSLQRMQSLPPSAQAVVVSVTDSSPHAVRPTLHGYRDVLRLEFLDIAEEHVGAAVRSWPLEPTPQEHERLSEHRGERLPALSDALAIRQFLDAHHGAAEALEVLIHCHAGASRSAAIAAWVAEHYGIPLVDVAGRGTDEANERLGRLLRHTS
jgi:predicted protein tyrosine phosphatase